MTAARNSFVKPWMFTAIFLVAGIGMLVGAVVSFVSTWQFIGRAVSAEGVVIALEERWDSDDSDYVYYPRVAFETEDRRQVEFTSDTGSRPASFDVGEAVSVLFDPAEPQSARIDSFLQLWLLPLILFGMGTVFSAVGSALTAGAAREAMQARPASAIAADRDTAQAPDRPANAVPASTTARQGVAVERSCRD